MIDVAAKLQEETRRSKTSFKAVVNDCLRRGLEAPSEAELAAPFSVEPRPMGFRAGLDLDDIGGLIATTDRDFTRFPGVEILNPIVEHPVHFERAASVRELGFALLVEWSLG